MMDGCINEVQMYKAAAGELEDKAPALLLDQKFLSTKRGAEVGASRCLRTLRLNNTYY